MSGMRKAVWLVLFLLPRLLAAQAHLVKDIATKPQYDYGSGIDSFSMTVAGSTLYFSATTLEYGAELWKSDGTAAGTSLVADLRFGPLGSYPSGLTAFGTGLAFIAGDDDGTWLWITRGTAATTTKIAAASSSWTVLFNGTILFAGHDAVHG